MLLLQDSNQLSTCEPRRIRYHVCGVCSTKSHFEENIHPPRGGWWFRVMQNADKWELRMGGCGFLVYHFGCCCC